MRKSLQLLTGHILILRGLEREDMRFEGGGGGWGERTAFLSLQSLPFSLLSSPSPPPPFPETPSRTLGRRLRIHPRLRVV